MLTVAEELTNFIVSDLLYDRPQVSVVGDTDLFEAGLVDSVGLMRLVVHIEETYRIAVADDEVVPDNFSTLSRLAAYVTRKRGGKP